MRRLIAVAAVAALTGGVAAPPASAESDPSKFGLAAVAAELSSSEAGAHADLTTTIAFSQDLEAAPESGVFPSYARVRNLEVELPAGIGGNPNAIPQCTAQQLTGTASGFEVRKESCPQDSQVGVVVLDLHGLGASLLEPVFNMEPPGGDSVARLGFVAALYPTFVDLRLRSHSDYGLTATIQGAAAEAGLVRATTIIWGVPADPSHDPLRITPYEGREGLSPPGGGRASGQTPAPFLSNPTSCGISRQLAVSAESYELSGRRVSAAVPFPEITGCGKPGFSPTLEVQPTSRRAAAPTGLDASLTIPQNEAVNGRATAHLRDAEIALPEGMAIAPGAADGLAACTAEQAGYRTTNRPACPDAAKIGTVDIDVPALSDILHGAVYQRAPEVGKLFRIWLITDQLGVQAKIPGEIEVDPASGQITSLFLDNPQVPLRGLELHLKSGPRAPLANPPACGTYRTLYRLAPWSGTPAVPGTSSFAIDEGCDTGGFDPSLDAGTTRPTAGGFSPFVLTLKRDDGESNVSVLQLRMPPGLLARLRGVPLCERQAAATGDCPAASQVGKVIVAIGPGSSPLWIPQPGKRPTAVYLAGPYKGAPLSIVAVVPAQAGPFDLGDQVVRSAIYVDPRTAQATIKSDPLPQIIQGIPVTYRTIHVAVDRPNFTLNPTGCAQKSVDATVTSNKGAVANPSSLFNAVNCARLPFRPKLTLRLKGGTKRTDHPALTAILRPRPGDANIASAQVALPHSAFLEQAHIRTICTRVQYAAGAGHGSQCPAGSIYGHATAYSPLFDQPLEGPVFLRSSSHNLPDLVIALHGPASLPIEIEAVGRIDSVGGGIRSSFEAIPDAPLSKVVLSMQGGKKGLIVNSRNLCAGEHRANAQLEGHNGKRRTIHPELQAQCPKARKGKPANKRSGGGR